MKGMELFEFGIGDRGDVLKDHAELVGKEGLVAELIENAGDMLVFGENPDTWYAMLEQLAHMYVSLAKIQHVLNGDERSYVQYVVHQLMQRLASDLENSRSIAGVA